MSLEALVIVATAVEAHGPSFGKTTPERRTWNANALKHEIVEF